MERFAEDLTKLRSKMIHAIRNDEITGEAKEIQIESPDYLFPPRRK